MVAIPKITYDATLAAVDTEMPNRDRRREPRKYLGMSAIGGECSRKLWYGYHHPIEEEFDAATIRRFMDGHKSEDIIADRLRLLPGLTLHTHDPETQKQFELSDFDDKFQGHMDGVILGLVQAPKTWHVWEAKAVNDKKFEKFRSMKRELGEKNVLKVWDTTYYAQAQCYMGYADLQRHYLTVCTPGVRDWEAVRTEFNQADFDAIRDKADRILNARAPLARISNDPNWFICKWCQYNDKCHGTETLPT